MKKNHCHKFLVFGCTLLFLQIKAQQQNFKFKAALDTVKASQFYKIGLPPSITSKCQQTISDIRIADADGKQIPFILKEEKSVINEQSFVQLPILSNKKESDKQTHITIENKQGGAISELWIVTTNADAQRMVDVVGSNNQKDWFIIKEKLPFSNAINTDSTEVAQSVSLALSNYKFYQIVFLGKDILPPNIIKVGIYKSEVTEGQFISNPLPIISQKDSSDKHSYVQLLFDAHYQVDKLLLTATGAKYFKRLVSVYELNNQQKNFLNSFYISSDAPLSFPISAHAKKLLLVIDNEDNQPLKIPSVKAYQLQRYLLTFLEANKSYQLLFGDSAIVAPKYDLSFFKDSITNQNTVRIAVGEIELISSKTTKAESNKTNITSWLIWVAIAVAMIILLLLVKNMLQQLKKNNSSL